MTKVMKYLAAYHYNGSILLKAFFSIGVWVEKKQCLQGSLLPRVPSIYQGLSMNAPRIRRGLWIIGSHLRVVFLLVLCGSDKVGSTWSCTVLLKATGEWRGGILACKDDRSRTESFHWSSEFGFLSCYCKNNQFGILLNLLKSHCFNEVGFYY